MRGFSRLRLDSFLAGLSLGVFGSYLLYALFRGTKKKQSLLGTLLSLIRTEPPEVDVDAAVQFYYEEADAILPPVEEREVYSSFPARCALLCERHTEALRDFTGELEETTCVDVGCSVGGTSFELSRCFQHVLGIDPSKELIKTAEQMKEKRRLDYTTMTDGNLKVMRSVKLDDDLEVQDVRFKVEDPCRLPDFSSVDCILSALLLTRLPKPKAFLQSIPRFLKRNGTCVIISCYDPDVRSTDPQSSKHPSSQEAISEDELLDFMTELGFELVHEENLPYFKKLSSRRYEWNIGHATVWKHEIQPTML